MFLPHDDLSRHQRREPILRYVAQKYSRWQIRNGHRSGRYRGTHGEFGTSQDLVFAARNPLGIPIRKYGKTEEDDDDDCLINM